MATVRITKELISTVTKNARDKFADAISKAGDAKPDDTWGDYIYDKLFGKYYHTMKELPKQFFLYSQTITVRSVGGIHISLNFSMSEPKPMPQGLSAEAVEIAERGCWNGQYELKHDLVWGELYAEVKTWDDNCKAIRQKQKDFEFGVTTVLNAFSTLAPALKKWPPLWDLLPDDVKARHKEITVREKKAAPSVDRDTLGKLTGVATAVKLGAL